MATVAFDNCLGYQLSTNHLRVIEAICGYNHAQQSNSTTACQRGPLLLRAASDAPPQPCCPERADTTAAPAAAALRTQLSSRATAGHPRPYLPPPALTGHRLPALQPKCYMQAGARPDQTTKKTRATAKYSAALLAHAAAPGCCTCCCLVLGAAVGLELLLVRLEATVAKLGGGVDELCVRGGQQHSSSSEQNKALADGEGSVRKQA